METVVIRWKMLIKVCEDQCCILVDNGCSQPKIPILLQGLLDNIPLHERQRLGYLVAFLGVL